METKNVGSPFTHVDRNDPNQVNLKTGKLIQKQTEAQQEEGPVDSDNEKEYLVLINFGSEVSDLPGGFPDEIGIIKFIKGRDNVYDFISKEVMLFDDNCISIHENSYVLVEGVTLSQKVDLVSFMRHMRQKFYSDLDFDIDDYINYESEKDYEPKQEVQATRQIPGEGFYQV
jgi:hypothetical protein